MSFKLDGIAPLSLSMKEINCHSDQGPQHQSVPDHDGVEAECRIAKHLQPSPMCRLWKFLQE